MTQPCHVCKTEPDNTIILTSEDGFTICEDCIDELTNILNQVRAKIDEVGIEKMAQQAHRELDS